MMTKNKCRSKNPSTCPFHGNPTKSINTMLMNGNISECIEFRANLDNKVNKAQVELNEAETRLASVETEIQAKKIVIEMEETGRKQFSEQEWAVIEKWDRMVVAKEKRIAASRLGGATNRDDADFEHFLKTQSGNKKIQNASEETQVKIFREQINTLEKSPGKTFSNKDLYEKHHKAKEDIRKATQRVALETKLRDEAIGNPSIPVTDGYKALQRYLPKDQQKAFENYNYNLNKILNNNKLGQSQKEETTKTLKNVTLDNLEHALYKAKCSTVVSRELITFPAKGKKKSYEEEINDAEHLLKTFKSAPTNAIFTDR